METNTPEEYNPKAEKPKQKITSDPANVMALCYMDAVEKLLSREKLDKYIEISKWLPGDDEGVGRTLKPGKKSHSRSKKYLGDKVLLPIIGKDIQMPWGYMEKTITEALKVFDIFGKDIIFKVHPTQPMPLLIMEDPVYARGSYESFAIIIAPRIYEGTEEYRTYMKEQEEKALKKMKKEQDIGCRDSP